MATPGTYISAVGHTGLLVWLLAGWGLSSEPLEFETTQITTVSGEEFAALMAASAPTPGTADPATPVQPDIEEAPDLPAPDDTVAEVVPPEPITPPVEETPPPAPPDPPAPVADVQDTPPEVVNPSDEASPAIDEPLADTPPQQRPSDRVAPDPVQAPDPEVQIDDIVQDATAPSETPPEVVVPEDPVDETAQDEATDEIVAEAATPSGAPERSLRPAARPNRPAPVEEPAAEPVIETATAEPADTSDTVNELLEGVVSEDTTPAQPDVPQGPPLTGSESEGFRVAVNACWNVDPGSVSATVTVVAGFSLTPEGKVENNDVRFVSSQGAADAVDVAFAAARRAILRCQGQGGYDLPAEKYGQWKDVEITFDPSGMRLR